MKRHQSGFGIRVRETFGTPLGAAISGPHALFPSLYSSETESVKRTRKVIDFNFWKLQPQPPALPRGDLVRLREGRRVRHLLLLFCLALLTTNALAAEQIGEWTSTANATIQVGPTRNGGFPLSFAFADGRKTSGQAVWETADAARSFRFSRDDTGEEYWGKYADDKTIEVRGPDSTERWTFVRWLP